jgi:AraC family transcriptional regulator of adaptative response / DNA-3-methyladenine glycosylase II
MDSIAGLDPEALDRARISRDPRFDGKFYIGVTSTGIYCRPICPSRCAKRANVRFFVSSAAAEAGGFRPCLRCRPEAAPGTPAWIGTAAVVRRALRLINDGALDEDSVESLAARLGIGTRHLLRLFARHVGASPLAVAHTRRLHFAVCLLEQTNLPITQIALASGFGSSRRFNDAFRSSYRRTPRELRKSRRATGGHADSDGEVVLRLAYRPPYDWQHVRDFLALRAISGVECVDERGYARTVACQDGHALIRVRPVPGADALELCVAGASAAALLQLSATARRVFDLAADPQRIDASLQGIRSLQRLCGGGRGCAFPGSGSRSSARCAPCSVNRSVLPRVGRSLRGWWRVPAGRYVLECRVLRSCFPMQPRWRGPTWRVLASHAPAPRPCARSRMPWRISASISARLPKKWSPRWRACRVSGYGRRTTSP